jgi:hypothetical protein
MISSQAKAARRCYRNEFVGSYTDPSAKRQGAAADFAPRSGQQPLIRMGIKLV